MNIEEYQNKSRELYDRFAYAVAGILGAAVAKHSEIKLQQIQSRAKSVDSLSKKLVGESLEDIETKIKDLAGARIILYSNSDIDRFENLRILFDNFDVVWDRTKFHYPVPADGKGSHFIGRNYVVKLKETRIALPEYADFVGLQCEIQVQTILNHAWSEVTHDTIYKSPSLPDINTKNVEALEERMNAIQKNYLLPAGYEFQKVLNDFEQLASGQSLIEAGILKRIEKAENNNDLVSLLDSYKDGVLPIMNDLPSIAPDIRKSLISAVGVALDRDVEPISTPYGTLPGKGITHIIDRTLSIINGPFLRYLEPRATFQSLIDLFDAVPDDAARMKIVASAGELAKHELKVWEKYGPAAQTVLLEIIEQTPAETRERIKPLIIKVMEEALATEINGTSSTSATVIWSRGAVIISDQLNQIRDKVISYLREFFDSARDDGERGTVFEALKSGLQRPHVNQVSDELIIRLYQDQADIIGFLTDRIEQLSNFLLQRIERQVYLYYRWAGNDSTGNESLQVIESREGVRSAAIAFRDRADTVDDYQIYKTLVGFEPVLGLEWDGDDDVDSYEKRNCQRQEKMQALLVNVNNESSDVWFERLDRFASSDGENRGALQNLGDFIADIAKENPEIGVEWLNSGRGRAIGDFTPGILRGLYASSEKETLDWINQSVAEKRSISHIAKFARYANPFLPELLEELARLAVSDKDLVAANHILGAVSERARDFGLDRSKRLCVEMIEFHAEQKEHSWTNSLWVFGNKSGILQSFDAIERDRLFQALTTQPTVDYTVEEILSIYVSDCTEEVIDYFGNRLEIEIESNASILEADRYEAIPFDFHILSGKIPPDKCRAVVDKIRSWSKKDSSFTEYRGGKLIVHLFPQFEENLFPVLVEDAQSGDREKQKFILAVTKNLEGASSAWAILRELVANLPNDSDLMTDVEIALGSRGVVSGEFGSRNALMGQKKLAKEWLSDERENVKGFAERLIKSLENQIAAEQRRAESDIALRRLEYNEPLNEKSDEDPNVDK